MLINEPDLSRNYMFQSIDRSATMKRTDSISRSVAFTKEMRKRDMHISHSTIITDYAHDILNKIKEQ